MNGNPVRRKESSLCLLFAHKIRYAGYSSKKYGQNPIKGFLHPNSDASLGEVIAELQNPNKTD
ncbi:hypothetical protein Lser_V15G07707 [Lactuca serriola]